MYFWNVSPDLPSPFQISKYATDFSRVYEDGINVKIREA